ncbi:hypothetical protein ACH4SK_30915 [Streptomyces inhibens]
MFAGDAEAVVDADNGPRDELIGERLFLGVPQGAGCPDGLLVRCRTES